MSEEDLVELTKQVWIEDKESSAEDEEDQQQKALERFNKRENRLVYKMALKRADGYLKKGASYAAPYDERCEKVGRQVYFMDYFFNGEDRSECMEYTNCPVRKDCKRYNRNPFGRKKSSRLKKIN